MKKNIIILVLIAFTFVGCKKFLEEEPKKQVTIQTVEHLDALLNNATAFVNDGGNRSAIFSTDDTEIPMEAYKNSPNRFALENLHHYVFGTDDVESLTTDAFWTTEFKIIFTANLVLYYVDKVTGSAEDKIRIKADAHFIRAFSNWNLANNYCLPYSKANEKAMGLPLKKSLAYDESLERKSLKETYDFIMEDLIEAEKTNVEEVDPLKPWRISKKGIHAFMSRYYLMMGEYDKSLEYAEKAMLSQKVKLYDFKTIVAGTPNVYANPSVTLVNSEMHNWDASKFLYWPEHYFARFSYTGNQWRIPSKELIALYDKDNDLRYKWFMIPNSNRRFLVMAPEMYRYNVFSDGRYAPVGPSIAEMLLNKAEVLARKKDMSGAMAALKVLRDSRFSTSVPLQGNDALKLVLEERRREMPFTMRWLDIRRFSVNEDPSDDVVVKRKFFKVNPTFVDMNEVVDYVLPNGSSRYATPINGIELDLSQGQIKQNNY